MLSEMGQMEILPQIVGSNLSLYPFTREGHQTPSPSSNTLYCTGINKALTYTYNSSCSLFWQCCSRGSRIEALLYLNLKCMFTMHTLCCSLRLFTRTNVTKSHLELWNGELAAGGQFGFGNGALEFLYTG